MEDKNLKKSFLTFSIAQEDSIPKFVEVTNKEYVKYGKKNDYPLMLIELKNSCPLHNAIINSVYQQVIGDGIRIKDGKEDAKLEEFINKSNSKNESLWDVASKIVYDYILFGGWSSSIVWKKSKENFELYHTDFSTIRTGKAEPLTGVINNYYFSNDWAKYNPKYEMVNPLNTDKKSGTQLYYFKDYSPNNVYYPLPLYVGGVPWILIDTKLAEFFNSYLESGCFPSLFINLNTGRVTDDEASIVYNELMEQFQGSSKAGRVIINFSENKETSPDITPLNSNDDDDKFKNLSELTIQQILSSWRITDPEIVGVSVPGKLGSSNTAESQELFFNTVIKPIQGKIEKELNYLLGLNGFENGIEFISSQPVSFSLSESALLQVLTINELREKIGEEPIISGDVLPNGMVPTNTIDDTPTDDTMPVDETSNDSNNKIATN